MITLLAQAAEGDAGVSVATCSWLVAMAIALMLLVAALTCPLRRGVTTLDVARAHLRFVFPRLVPGRYYRLMGTDTGTRVRVRRIHGKYVTYELHFPVTLHCRPLGSGAGLPPECDIPGRVVGGHGTDTVRMFAAVHVEAETLPGPVVGRFA